MRILNKAIAAAVLLSLALSFASCTNPETKPTETGKTNLKTEEKTDGTATSKKTEEPAKTADPTTAATTTETAEESITAQVKIGSAILSLQLRKKNEPKENASYDVYVTDITAFGHNVSFDNVLDESKIAIDADFYKHIPPPIFEYDGHIIAAKTYQHALQEKLCIISKYGIYKIDNTIEWDNREAERYTKYVYGFYLSEDGKTLNYTRKPYKYVWPEQSIAGYIKECCSRDELFCEYGTVTFDGAEPVYHPERRESISEAKDLDKFFDMCVEAGLYYTADMTLDELIADNAGKYPIAK